MSADRLVMLISVLGALAGLVLAAAHHPYWLIFSAFLAINLLRAVFSGYCPMAIGLRRLGARNGALFD